MANDAADDGSNVVFLLSSPRAGSTLLSAILNRHSRILCPAEPWFLLSLHGLYYGTGTGITAYDQRLADIALRELASEQEFLSAARAFAASVYGARLASARRSVFVDKTPRYYHVLPFLSALFPRARMIWLKRNPLDVAASYKTSWGVPVAELVGRDLSPNSFDLTVGLVDLGKWFDGSPGRLEVSYEALVANPEGLIARVLGFLELKTEPGLAEYGADAESMSGYRRSSLGDKKVLDHIRPHARSVGQWREAFSSGELGELLAGIGADTFHRMGYGDSLAEASRRAGFSPAEKHRAPHHFDKLCLYQKWFAAALPAGETKSGVASSETGVPAGTREMRIASLEAQLELSEADRAARLAVIERQGAELSLIAALQAERDELTSRLTAAEADREARLAVIRRQGAELGRLPGLETERDELAARLTAAEADSEARLAVIQRQGAELGWLPGLQAERDELAARLTASEADGEARLSAIERQRAEVDALMSALEEVGQCVEAARPRTILGMAPPSEVRRLRELLSTLAALAQPRRGRT